MKFGLDLYPHFGMDLPAPLAFDHAVQQVQAAHANGFDGIFASHHYLLGTTEQMFQPVPLLSRLAADAPGMTFGTAVFLLSLHNPVEVAELVATMDIICGGKFVLGVGQGYRDAEFSSFGIPKASRGSRLEEAVEVIRKLWSADHVTWDGRYFPLNDVTINPKPIQQPGPPIWVGGDTLHGVRRAAKIGDAWLASPRHSKGFIHQAVRSYKEQRDAMGLPVLSPIFFREMYVAKDRMEAEQEIKASFERLYQVYHQAGQPGEQYNRSFDELKKERIIVGNPQDVIEEIRDYQDQFGAEYMFFRSYYPGMDPSKTTRCIERFGQEVIPYFS